MRPPCCMLVSRVQTPWCPQCHQGSLDSQLPEHTEEKVSSELPRPQAVTQPARGVWPFGGVLLRPPNPHTNHAPWQSLPHVRRGQGRVLSQLGGIQPQWPLPPHLLACPGAAMKDGQCVTARSPGGEEQENVVTRRRKKRQVSGSGLGLSQQVLSSAWLQGHVGSRTQPGRLPRGWPKRQSPHLLHHNTH